MAVLGWQDMNTQINLVSQRKFHIVYILDKFHTYFYQASDLADL